MTFSVNINGQTLSDGVSVFPFSFGQLLDERLDEAYLHITKSATPVYKPTTEVRIDLREGNATVKQFHFIVAKDNAYELPVGSVPRRYKHNIHLIERTKLLEGIYCQSITFTNSIGNNYLAGASVSVPYNFDSSNGIPLPTFYGFSNVKTPVKTMTSIYIPTAKEAAENENVKKCLAGTDSGLVWDRLIPMEEYGSEKTCVSIKKNMENAVVKYWDENSDTIADKSFTVSYYLVYKNDLNSSSLSISFSLDIFAATNTLPLKPLTVTDCINRVLDLAEPRFDYATLDAPRFYLNAEQAAEFDKITAPEFTMTQCTLREQLKVIGGFIHGEPRLKPSGEIYYDMYGDPVESAEIDASTPYVYRGMSHDIAQYCTQIDTSASNIVNALNYAQGVVFSPDRTNTKTIRTESVNIRATEQNGYIETDFPIQDIVKVECGLYVPTGDTYGVQIGMQDITPYIFTETAYNAHLSTYGGGYPRAKSYGLYYGIGQKGIRGLFFKEQSANLTLHPYLEYYAIVNILAAAVGWTPKKVRENIAGDYTRLVFRISYVPIYNTRFSHGKQYAEDGTEYTQIYNQSENIIETRYFGENVKGVAARLGNVEQTRTYIFNTFSQIPKVGELINVGTEDIPDEYAISAVNTEVLPKYYKTTVALTKDFNRISEYVGISSNKRVYEVSEREAYLRNILLKEYAIVGKDGNYSAGIFRDPAGIASAFNPSITGADNKTASPISSVWAWGGTYQNPYQNGTQTGKAPLPLVSLPVASSAFGNSLVFSWGYKDNYSAGARLTEEITSGDVSGKWVQDVAYGDAYGRMYFYNFFLLGKNEETALGYEFALSSPFVPSEDYFLIRASSKIKTEAGRGYRVRKDSREILNFNFELEFKTNCKNLIIGSGIASSCRLVGATGGAAVIHFPISKIGRFDRIYPVIGGDSVNVSRSGLQVRITLPSGWQRSPNFVIHTPYVAGTSYQVEDELGNETSYTPYTGGEILLACNNPEALYQELGGNTIYINLSKSQKEVTQ